MEARVFFVERDLIATLPQARIDVLASAGFGLVGSPAHAEPVPSFWSSVEMGVPVTFRGHEDGARAPVHAHRLFTLWPKVRVAVSAQSQHVDAGAMTMGGGMRTGLGAERVAAADG